MYYRLRTGKIVGDTYVSIAFEITRGKSAFDDYDAFLEWKGLLGLTPIDEEKADIRDLISSGATFAAIRIYKDRHNCSVRDATDAVYKIKNEIDAEIEEKVETWPT